MCSLSFFYKWERDFKHENDLFLARVWTFFSSFYNRIIIDTQNPNSRLRMLDL